MDRSGRLRLSSAARTMPGYADRQWAVREAVLKWAYNEDISGNPAPLLGAFTVATSVRWRGEPITEDEVVWAALWLVRTGLFHPVEIGAHQLAAVRHPRITDEGVRAALSPNCVRARPAHAPTVVADHTRLGLDADVRSPDPAM
ncbi:hypothetical protein [Nocardia sp. A7]|uniref:hypothetical protein n=1 Tax=Nocardia sp. A7 TaxID=2789274 RepID=UPI00397935C1